MRAGIYGRVSTDEQVQEGFSISAQKDKSTSFVLSQDWDIVDYYFDEGISAKDTQRPQLQRLLQDVRDNKIDVVVVYKLDRLTRSVLDLYYLLREFDEHEVKFKSVTEIYDTTTAIGRLFITLVAALAQWERENLAERVRFGMEQMIAEGKRPGAPIPFGYDNENNVILDEKAILHEIRRLYLEGYGFRAIAQIMNQQGKLKRGVDWAAFSVSYVLDNPYYAGLIRWGSKKPNGKYASRKREEKVSCIIEEGNHEPIFSRDEYDEHIAEMKRRSFQGHSKKSEYWFAGVLRCGRCGKAMTGRFKKSVLKNGEEKILIFYICSSRQLGEGCDMPLFRQALVEKLVINYIHQAKVDYKKVREMSKDGDIEKSKVDVEIEDLRRQLKKIQDRKKKWQYAFAEDLITIEELKERNAEERSAETAIQDQLNTLQAKKKATNVEAIDMMLDLPDIWTMLDDKDKNKLIRTLFRKIVVDTPESKVVARRGKDFPSSIKNIEYN